ncbi:MAG: RidA family protein [Oscillospiraceae bacterium]|nr:RidA family protein [Oscillospiraceae bacterium]
MKKAETNKAPAAIGPYCQAAVTGGIVYTSGQIPLDPETGLMVGADIAAQTERIIKNLAAVLEAAGSDLDHVINTTCFITDMGSFAAFNEVYGRYFTSKPARSCVEVSALPKGALVEIELIAEVIG